MEILCTLKQKEWTEVEKYQLWLVGHLNISLEIASHWFQRSPNALCKAMARYGIRPSGTVRRGPKTAERKRLSAPLNQLEDLFTLGSSEDSDPTALAVSTPPQSLPLPLKSSLERYGLRDNPPWLRAIPVKKKTGAVARLYNIMAARVNTPQAGRSLPGQTAAELRKRARLAKTLRWVSLADIIAELRKGGKEIRKSDKAALFPQGGGYFIDGRPCSAAHLVIEINKKRLEKGLEPLLVCEVTE